MNEAQKRKWQWRNAIKLAIAYCLLIAIICTLDYFGIPEDKPITISQEPCGLMADEVITMTECYDIMLNLKGEELAKML